MVVVIAVVVAAMAAMPAKGGHRCMVFARGPTCIQTTDKVNIRNVSESAPYFCSFAKRRTGGGVKTSGEGSRTPPQIRESGGGLTKLVQFLLGRKWRSDGMRVSGCTQWVHPNNYRVQNTIVDRDRGEKRCMRHNESDYKICTPVAILGCGTRGCRMWHSRDIFKLY